MKFTVPGDPVPKERPRHGRGRTYTPQSTLNAEAKVRAAWLRATRTSLASRVMVPKPAEIELLLDFRCATNRRADLDNLTKLVMDALNGFAYTDDSQVTRLVVDVFRGVGPNLACSNVTVIKRP